MQILKQSYLSVKYWLNDFNGYNVFFIGIQNNSKITTILKELPHFFSGNEWLFLQYLQ